MDSLIEEFGKNNQHLAEKSSWLDPTGTPSAPAAWFVSNCHSKSGREDFASQLQQYVGVDIYGAGKCSKLTCSLKTDQVCLERLNSTYKV